MNNFEFYCPTRVVFGKGTIANLSKLIDKDKKIMMIYGGGSIKKNGVYEQVKAALNGYHLIEFGGIEPNPTYETCMKARQVAIDEGVDFLLAVGGGSTLDGTKFIAAAVKYEGEDPYDILTKELPVKTALPLADVITLPATGSEMNGNFVISRISTGEKLASSSEIVMPKFSIIDPTVTFSLPKQQTINGIVDTFVHTMEDYCTYDVNTPLQDSWSLGLMQTLISEGPKVLKNPEDYEAQANIFWCATCGLNYWPAVGVVQDWATHMIGHEITAFYGLDHGQSLAIVMPRLLSNQIENKRKKLEKMGKFLFNVDSAEETIKKIEEFFKSLGAKTTLAEYGINPIEVAEKIRDRFNSRGTKLGEHSIIDGNVVFDILINC